MNHSKTSESICLITGATGATGGAALSELLARGANVRALVHREDERAAGLRQRGAQVVVGDLLDFDAVRAALVGVQRAYFVFPIGQGIVRASAQFAQAAREAGVEAIVNMSQISARADSRSEAARQHWLAERVFDWSGVPVTHLRPTFFAEWLFYLSAMVRRGQVYAPFGAGKHAPIAAADQGRVIAAILQDPAPHRGQTYLLRGPEEMTHAEICGRAGHVLGRTVTYQQVPFDVFAQNLTAGSPGVARNDAASGYGESDQTSGSGPTFLLQHLREVALDHDQGLFAGTDAVVERLTGRPALTVEEFVAQHRAAFC